jgi:hypothetical protein
MRRNHITFLLVLVIASTPAIRAVEFAGGTGAPQDPYQIATAEQLISIGSDPNLLNKCFVMVDDIDLDPNLSPQYLFHRAVIGAEYPWFSGAFDGNGFRIRHLTIEGKTERGFQDELGLFAQVGNGGEVRHLILEDIRIISSSKWSMAGGLCSSNNGVLFRCSISGTVSADDTTGGLVAWNYGTVEESYSSCTVSARSSGGLIGCNKGWVQNCSATGYVRQTDVESGPTGGLVGTNYEGLISHCYAACQVDGTGGLVGAEYPPESTALSYFRAPPDGGGPDNGIGTPLTEAQMRRQESFIGWEFWGPDTDSALTQWLMPEGDYPQLAWLSLKAVPDVSGLSIEDAHWVIKGSGFRVGRIVYDYDHAVEPGRVITTRPYRGAPAGTPVDIVLSLGPYAWSANPGKGEPMDPYLISTAGQLDCLAYQPELWGSHFKLMGDLILTGRVYDRPPLGLYGSSQRAFSGTLDGNGHIIESLTIQLDSLGGERPNKLGLFAEIASSGHVKDLGLKHVSAKGKAWNISGGMLCGANLGHIERCYCSGTVQGQGNLGGLVGNNGGIIENCYADGSVENIPGGIGQQWYGGLIGRNFTGTVRTCYATCSVPWGEGGGLVALNESGSVVHCLWDVQASSERASDGGVGLTTRELMDVQVLQDYGWGENPNWIFHDGKDYPRLIWEGTPGDPVTQPSSSPSET